MKILHTADWQIGKPFAWVDNQDQRARLQQQRIHMLEKIAAIVRDHEVELVVVAGDLFDSPGVTRSTVSQACTAIGRMEIPVIAIPGNHDHGGPGSIWEQEYFRREQQELAPNLHILLTPQPVELDSVVLLPCPLLRRHETHDPTQWLRTGQDSLVSLPDKPRIALIHGSVQDFQRPEDDDEATDGQPNLIDLGRIAQQEIDYLALGDWHGMKQVGPRSWYSGTPEPDRFPKGESNQPGYVLIARVERGQLPVVTPVATAKMGWYQHAFHFADDQGPEQLQQSLAQLAQGQEVHSLLRLSLQGALGIDAAHRLRKLLESWQGRYLSLQVVDSSTVVPTDSELDALCHRSGDPLISLVANRLAAQSKANTEEAVLARAALQHLYTLCHSSERIA